MDTVATAIQSFGIEHVHCWVGHDVISGRAARASSKHFGGQLALIHHMSYVDYQFFKGKQGREIEDLDRQQRRLFSTEGALLFAVGPLLGKSCKRFSSRQPVVLVPGLPDIPTRDRNLEVPVGIISGRLDRVSDAVKQGRLAVAGFGAAIREGRWASPFRPRLYVAGIEPDQESEISTLAAHYAGRSINVVATAFDADRENMLDRLADCNVAMMLSLHEGFGLVGWEAIAAEVPLILSRGTGLYHFIDTELHGLGTICVIALDIQGQPRAAGTEAYSDDDLIAVKQAVLNIGSNIEGYVGQAAALKAQLKKYTWKLTAKTLIDGIKAGDTITVSTVDNTGQVGTGSTSVHASLFRHFDAERLGWSRAGISGQLVQVRSKSNDLDHNQFIRSADFVRIVMNDRRRFFEKYEWAFRERAASEVGDASTRKTEICLLAPEGPHLGLVATRSEKTEFEQRQNIIASANLIKDIFSEQSLASLSLFGIKDFLPYCMFQYDELVFVSLYPAYARLEELPMLFLSPTGESSDVYYSIIENANLMFHRASAGHTLFMRF
jgi:glycosyltransferase involved in cell wall biosynthesis